MSESKIQKDILNYLEEKNYYVVKVIKANKAGVPDILFCKNGMFNAIEVKAKGKKTQVSELQKIHLQLIINCGGKAIVADCLEDVIKDYK